MQARLGGKHLQFAYKVLECARLSCSNAFTLFSIWSLATAEPKPEYKIYSIEAVGASEITSSIVCGRFLVPGRLFAAIFISLTTSPR